MRRLHIDIETYSSVDLKSSGVYKYCASEDFEILLIAYAYDDGPVRVVTQLTTNLKKDLTDPNIEKHAYNANFERTAFKAVGIDSPVEQWRCTMVKAAYCGLPLSLGQVSAALSLGDKGKLSTGNALIRYFCMPVKPTLTNGGRTRNLPEHNPEKWESFKQYCRNDVIAEREIHNSLIKYNLPDTEIKMYALDQRINDYGVLVDLDFVKNACAIDGENSQGMSLRLKELTGLDNPNSATQLRQWLSHITGKNVTSVSKGDMIELLESSKGRTVQEVVELRLKSAKTSIKKYEAMLSCAGEDSRARGLFQFYGANRTGRWAGRLIQLQNLPQNHLKDLDFARRAVASQNYEVLDLYYDDCSSILSQLIRTAFVAPKDKILAVADFSAIEARVIAWLADEQWRLEVFKSHGKIYEASASMMFGVPIEEVTKGSELRQKGKVAELALGYQGGVGALKQMGAEAMGVEEDEMQDLIDIWRAKNRHIVKMWLQINRYAIEAVRSGRKNKSTIYKGITFLYDGRILTVTLPSGRSLCYYNPYLKANKWGGESLVYEGLNQQTKQWEAVETYGGKLVENIVQAIARDLLVCSMLALDRKGYKIIMHVHDEVVCEIPDDDNKQRRLEEMCLVMGEEPWWGEGLPLKAEGYLTEYYKKD